MSSADEQDAKLDYFKMLFERLEVSYSNFEKSVRNFYLFSLMFFVFTWFKTSELSLFGAKVQIPQDWITAIAPLLLSLFFVIQVYQGFAQAEYRREVNYFFPEAIKGGNWKPSKEQIHWVMNPPFAGMDESFTKNKFAISTITWLYALIFMSVMWLIPFFIIIYFLFLLWQLEFLLVVIVVSIVSILLSGIGLIIIISFFKGAK